MKNKIITKIIYIIILMLIMNMFFCSNVRAKEIVKSGVDQNVIYDNRNEHIDISAIQGICIFLAFFINIKIFDKFDGKKLIKNISLIFVGVLLMYIASMVGAGIIHNAIVVDSLNGEEVIAANAIKDTIELREYFLSILMTGMLMVLIFNIIKYIKEEDNVIQKKMISISGSAIIFVYFILDLLIVNGRWNFWTLVYNIMILTFTSYYSDFIKLLKSKDENLRKSCIGKLLVISSFQLLIWLFILVAQLFVWIL